jgi:putative ABC transport system permease protein
VIGIVKDFHYQSLHEPIRPLLFVLTHRSFNHILIRINTENLPAKIAAIEKIYKNFEPVYSFEFAFLEDQLNDQYAAEQRTGIILSVFTVIAILIASFGLFGMSLLTFQQKIKELSVRKVLGATVANILVLLVGDFTKLIVLAVILATPVAWWIMKEWLQNFSYQININPLVFVCSGLILLFLAWVTLSYFTLKASRLNPAETLKNE